MAKLTYPEAVKARKTAKEPENRMVIQLDGRLVLPHKDGVKLLEALANAEKLARYSSDIPPIESLDEYTVTSRVMGLREYERHKVAQLMGVSLRDVEQAEQAAAAAAADNPTP
jgi:hypothetical protein